MCAPLMDSIFLEKKKCMRYSIIDIFLVCTGDSGENASCSLEEAGVYDRFT